MDRTIPTHHYSPSYNLSYRQAEAGPSEGLPVQNPVASQEPEDPQDASSPDNRDLQELLESHNKCV